MARELHTLNDLELGMVNDYVEAGIADTPEEALQILIEQGVIYEKASTNISFAPEGFKELRLHTGHLKALTTQVNDIAEGLGDTPPFKKGNWYYGSSFPKNKDTKEIEYSNVEIGDLIGKNPEVIPTHILYKGYRFNPASPKTAVETTLGFSMSKDSQKGMIDLNSKKSLYTLRQEQLLELGLEEGEYSKVPQNDKIKFIAVIYGLLKVGDTWKQFYVEATIGKPEYNMIKPFLEAKKSDSSPLQKFRCTIETNEDKANKGNYFRILTIKEKVSDELAKEVSSLVISNIKNVSKFLADQKQPNKSTPNQEVRDEEDTLDLDDIKWDAKLDDSK